MASKKETPQEREQRFKRVRWTVQNLLVSVEECDFSYGKVPGGWDGVAFELENLRKLLRIRR